MAEADEDDEEDTTTPLYRGSPDDITSTVRVRAWKPGQVPPAVFQTTSMDRFPASASDADS